MPKARRESGAEREARRRAGVLAARPWRQELAHVRDTLAGLDAERRALLVRRDALVRTARASGATWGEVESLAGASRPALLKRGGGGV